MMAGFDLFIDFGHLEGCGNGFDLIDTPMFVRSETHVDELLNEMSHSKLHMAFVSDQGEIKGIITIEDILEELVGEIFDENDAEPSKVSV